MNKKQFTEEIRYTHITQKYLSTFMDVKDEIVKEMPPTETSTDNVLKKLDLGRVDRFLRAVEKRYIHSVEDYRLTDDRGTVQEFQRFAESLEIKTDETTMQIAIKCSLENYMGVYQQFPRGVHVETVNVSPDTIFIVRRAFNIYQDEPFSIAFKTTFGRFALREVDDACGVKGSKGLEMIYLNDGILKVDNASKYGITI